MTLSEEERHGRAWTYAGGKCRCIPCCKAKSDYSKEWRAKQPKKSREEITETRRFYRNTRRLNTFLRSVQGV